MVLIGAAASVQFAGDRALVLRVITVHNWTTYRGWIWLTGYVLDRRGPATDKRTIFVQLNGLHLAPPPARQVVRRYRRPSSN